jgi:uncharacterized protein YfdQ (DUF2303 family)
MNQEFNHTAMDAGAALTVPRYVGTPGTGHPYAILPEGYRAESLAGMLGAPLRRKGTTDLLDEASFIAYVNDEKTEGMTRIFGVKATPRFVAVFNDEGHSDHTAKWTCPLSREWKAWMESNKKPFGQTAFAQFLETRRLDISEPSAADMLEIAQSIEATSAGSFASKINRTNGNLVFGYTENTNATAGGGRLEVPEKFTIAIPVFDGGEKWKIDAFLRYRIKDGELALWFELDNPERALETAVNDVWERVQTQTALSILHGTPTTGR